MANAANILNNTILVPYHDSLTNSSHDLSAATIASDVETYNTGLGKKPALLNNKFSVSIISNGKTVSAGRCFSIKGLSVSRNVEKRRSGGEANYEIKMPGPLSYGEVTIQHLYTDSSVFLDWLINGADKGGVTVADVQITVGDDNGKMVYTLRDAFPVSWRLGNITVVNLDEVVRIRTIAATDSSIPLEELIIAYGRLDYDKGK